MRWGIVAFFAVWIGATGAQALGQLPAALAPPGAKTVVLYFVASDCPVSNRTMPEMLRVQREFTAQGVAFTFVYPNTYETSQSMSQHQAAFGAGRNAILDRAGALVALTHTRVTPEAAVLVRDGAVWKPAYVGRIDNRYLRLGVERPQATEHDVENAVRAVLAGKPVAIPAQSPVGCSIVNPKAPLLDGESSGAKAAKP